jgi:signal transduction histidine kinase
MSSSQVGGSVIGSPRTLRVRAAAQQCAASASNREDRPAGPGRPSRDNRPSGLHTSDVLNRWSETTLRRWALGLLVLVAGLVAFAIAVEPQLHGLAARQHPNAPEFDAGYAIIGCSLVLVGVLLGWLRPRNPIGWLLLLAGLCGSLCNAGQVYGALAIAAPEKHLPLGYLVLAAAAPLWVPALVIPATVVLARFPGGTVTGRWGRRFDRTVITGLVLLYLGYANAPNAITDEIRTSSPPHLVPKLVAEGVVITGGLLLLLGLAGTVVTTIHRMIRAGAPERQQIVLLLMATVTAVAGVVLAPPWLGFLAFLLVPTAIAVGVLRYRLLGVDVVVRRTLLYAALTGLVLAVFVAVTAALTALLPHGPAPVVVAASLIAVGLAPARDRLQRLVDRVVYGYRADPWSALARLSSPLGSSAGDDLLAETAEALARALRVPYVEIRDRGEDVLTRWGEGRAGRELPLRFGGETLGTLAIGMRPGEEVLASSELRLLNAVTPLVAVVVHALTLTAELQTAQSRLRDAVHTERQRLRQDLHDGLGPSLTGIGLGLEALESGSAPHSGELLGRLRTEAGTALEEVRRIIDDLRPGALDEQGLLEALHSRVAHAQHGSSGLRLELTAPDSIAVPPEVEVAAYRIVEEALTNVLKHADAKSCSIDISVDDALHVTVEDDGVGLAHRTLNGSGVGMQSMRERAERLGGRFAARDRAPGTEIRVDLPLDVR